MNATVQRRVVLAAGLAAAIIVASSHTGTRAAVSRSAKTAAPKLSQPDANIAESWNEKSAAAYLDRREDWWMEWPRAKRDHETFCVSCHTAVPYALSRPALGSALREQGPSVDERRLLDNVTKRVRLWKEVAPFYSDADRGVYKTAESRGTESVLNALILASHDAQEGQLSDDTRTAFDSMWAEQQTTGDKKGAWQWLRFGNEPWEADDSDYYGATLAAVALGTAPGNYRATPGIRSNLEMLREYLNREYATQTTINRVTLLWAAAKVPGLIARERRRAILAELLGKQQSDGGWTSSSLVGGWKRADGTPQETESDGYATGLVVFALEEAGMTPENAHLRSGLAWLTGNQDGTEGSWVAYSLNKNKEHHISPATALFMNDAATAYAVLALTNANRP
jgi:squalene-hopene/tetraprenyl-beta-curcumene cyclase